MKVSFFWFGLVFQTGNLWVTLNIVAMLGDLSSHEGFFF
jgi:hypothetical protein